MRLPIRVANFLGGGDVDEQVSRFIVTVGTIGLESGKLRCVARDGGATVC